MKKLCPWNTLKESAVFTFSNALTLGKILVVPLAIQIGFFFFEKSFFNVGPISLSTLSAAIRSPQDLILMVPNLLVINLTISLFAPRWIKFYHSPKSSVSFFAFEESQWKFFLYSLIFIGIFLGVLFLAPYLETFLASCSLPAEYGAFLIPVGALVSGLLATRLSFLWPALALSKPTGFRQAWEKTRCCYGKLLIITFVLAVFFAPALWLFCEMAYGVGAYGTLLGAIGIIAVTKLYLAAKGK